MDPKKKQKIKKYIIRGVIGLAVVIVVQGVVAARAPKSPVYTTDKPRRATIVSSFSEKGSVVTKSQQEVLSPIDGTVTEVLVTSGSSVETGQELFKVKSSAGAKDSSAAYAQYTNALATLQQTETQRSQAIAGIDQAKVAVLQAQNDVNIKNTGGLNPKTNSAYTSLEKQAIDATLRSAESQLASEQRKYSDLGSSITNANSQVNSGWAAYQSTQELSVVAEASGIVTNMTIAPGSRVSPSAPTFPMIIADVTSTKIKLKINETDISKVVLGQPVSITVPAFKDKVFAGTVTSLDSIGTTELNVVTYNAYITLSEVNKGIKPGMTTKITIETAKKENVLSIPTNGLRPLNGGKAVEVFDGTSTNADLSASKTHPEPK
jgi:HlyD family secretion protein